MTSPRPPALDPASLPEKSGSGYPKPFDTPVLQRHWRALGDALGLKNFGVNLVRLPPGVASSQRHWHTHEDEFVYVLQGEVALVTDGGEQALSAGMVAGFPAGKADGHHFINRSTREAVLLCVGDRRDEDEVDYPDIDLRKPLVEGKSVFTRKDRTPY